MLVSLTGSFWWGTVVQMTSHLTLSLRLTSDTPQRKQNIIPVEINCKLVGFCYETGLKGTLIITLHMLVNTSRHNCGWAIFGGKFEQTNPLKSGTSREYLWSSVKIFRGAWSEDKQTDRRADDSDSEGFSEYGWHSVFPTADGLDKPEWGPSLSEHASFQQGMKETSLVCVSVYVVWGWSDAGVCLSVSASVCLHNFACLLLWLWA